MPSNTDHENYVVTGKDQHSNRLIVAFENENESTLWARTYEVSELSFLSDIDLSSPLHLLGKARYRDESTPIVLEPRGEKMPELPSQNLNGLLRLVRFSLSTKGSN